jgi:hypothetical protein
MLLWAESVGGKTTMLAAPDNTYGTVIIRQFGFVVVLAAF